MSGTKINKEKIFRLKKYLRTRSTPFSWPQRETSNKNWTFCTQIINKKPLHMKDCYSDGSFGLLDCSFDNPFKKFLSEGQYFCAMSKNYGNKEKFSIHFPSIRSCGLVNWSFDNLARNMLVKKSKTFCPAQKTKGTILLLFLIFPQKFFNRHLKSSSFNSVQKLLAEGEKGFLSKSKNNLERIFLSKTIFPQIVFSDT